MIDAASDPKAVDPAILADALAHISRVAKGSESQTRRIRWIAVRAEDALAGKVFAHNGIRLPRTAGAEAVMNLRHRVKAYRELANKLTEALQRLEMAATETTTQPHSPEAARLANYIKNLAGDVLPLAAATLNPAQAETNEGAPNAHD